MKIGTKILLISGIVVGSIGVIIGGANIYFHLPIMEYYNASENTFMIPGLNDNFIQQGISYDKESNNFFICGYSSTKDNSSVYLVNKDTHATKRIKLNNQDGSKFTGHSGGLSVNAPYVYITYGDGLAIFDYASFIDQDNNSTANMMGYFKNNINDSDAIRCSCTTIHDNVLTICEYFSEPSYPTASTHKFTTSHGQYNQALGVSYALDSSSEFGINPTPLVAYSLPNKVQGVAFDGDYMYLSTSWGASFSHLYKHEVNKFETISQITIKDTSVNLLAVENYNLVKDLKAAPMSEEIEFVDGKMYTMCESASNKYIFGKITFAWWCVATDWNKVN